MNPNLQQSCTVRRILASPSNPHEPNQVEIMTSQGPWQDAISVEQAFADLVKSSWILEDVVFVKHARTEPLEAKIRKCVLDLSTVSESSTENLRLKGFINQWQHL